VTRATLLVQRALHGDVAWAFRAVNAVLAAAAAVLAYAILRAPRLATAPAAAALAAALFAAHPIASACVLPIASGRETLLPAARRMGACAAFLRPGRWARTLALAGFAAALFGKENSLAGAALFVWADLTGAAHGAPGRDLGRWLRRHAPVWAIALFYLLVRSQVLDLPPAAHLLSALRADPLGPLRSLAYALQSSFLPFGAPRYEPAFADWFGPLRSAAAALAAAALLGAAGLVAAREEAARRRALFFAGWFAILWAPTANFLPQEAPYAERYLLLAWLAIPALAASIASAEGLAPGLRRGALAALALAVVAAAAVTSTVASFYRDDTTFYRQWVRSSPRHANARMSLGTSLAREGRTAEALAELREAVRLDPRHGAAHFNLGVLLAQQGRDAEAAQHLEAALAANPTDAEARAYLERLRSRP
jgi:tetratricopeptide (TPR) repeat protein